MSKKKTTGDEARAIGTKLGIDWPEGFTGACGSKYPVSVKVNTLDQFGGVFKWSGFVDIILTNTNITLIPTQVELSDGTATVELEFRLSSESEEVTNVKLTNWDITTTLSDVITVYPNVTGISLSEE